MKDSTPMGAENSTGGEPLDTFDNAITNNPQAFDTPQEEEVAKLETQVEKIGEADEAQSKEEEGQEEKLKTEEKPEERASEDRKDSEEEAPKRIVGGKVKGRLGEKQIDFDPDTEVRVKVDGKYLNVPLSEMRDAYSSITTNRQLGEELQIREREVQDELDAYEAERGEVTGHLAKIGTLLDDEEGNPMDAIYYLLDMTGRNRNDYYRKILHHHLDEVESLQLMSDSERKSYFLEKENDYLKQVHESSSEAVKGNEETEAFMTNLNEQREAYGVSEEEFVESYNDLLELGETKETLTAETVLEYSTLYPVVEEAEEIVGRFDSELIEDDEIVRAVAESILEDPEVTPEEIIKALEASYGTPIEKQPKQKQTGQYGESYYSTSKPKSSKKDSGGDHVESFEDYDHYGTTYDG